jgi:hypothetical protein
MHQYLNCLFTCLVSGKCRSRKHFLCLSIHLTSIHQKHWEGTSFVWSVSKTGHAYTCIMVYHPPFVHMTNCEHLASFVRPKLFKIISDNPFLCSRWLFLLNLFFQMLYYCFILGRNELKFKLQLHDKE